MASQLTDLQLEQLLAGRVDHSLVDHPVASALTEGMNTLRNLPAATPSPALSEFVGVTSSSPTPNASPPTEILNLRNRPARPRKSKMLSTFTALVATTTGKLALGVTVAAAAVGGAQTTGIVDVVLDSASSEFVAAGPVQDETEAPLTAMVGSTEPMQSVSAEQVPAPEVESDQTEDDADTRDQSVADQTLTFPVQGVGSVSVVVADGMVSMTGVADPGWTASADNDSDEDEAEIRFSNGSRNVEVEAEIEDGTLQITVTENDVETEFVFDADGNPIEASDDHDDDESDHDDDDESDHDDEDDDESDHDDEDDDESDHDDEDDDDESDHDDEDDDDESDHDDDESDDDDDESDDDDD